MSEPNVIQIEILCQKLACANMFLCLFGWFFFIKSVSCWIFEDCTQFFPPDSSLCGKLASTSLFLYDLLTCVLPSIFIRSLSVQAFLMREPLFSLSFLSFFSCILCRYSLFRLNIQSRVWIIPIEIIDFFCFVCLLVCSVNNGWLHHQGLPDPWCWVTADTNKHTHTHMVLCMSGGWHQIVQRKHRIMDCWGKEK